MRRALALAVPLALPLALPLAIALAGCAGSAAAVHPRAGQIAAVGAESQYADVIRQIGGRYVAVGSILSNPDADPHAFEASASVARAVGAARLVVQNGLGYDAFIDAIEAATPNPRRTVISVQALRRLPADTANPHLWYSPATMPALAAALARTLGRLEPAHAAYFAANAGRFDRSLRPWLETLRQIRARYAGATVATSEPVGDYLLAAAGTRDLTPWVLQADVMDGIDPAAQTITAQESLLDHRRVSVFVYNRQVTDTLTETFETIAAQHGIPVVGVDETLPSGEHYQRWMLSETTALERALARGDRRSARP